MTDDAIIGISTYNVTPMKAGSYFHKIQCFCFDEQRLRPKETVEMVKKKKKKEKACKFFEEFPNFFFMHISSFPPACFLLH